MSGYGLDEAAADFVLILIVGVNCYVGWRYGLVRRAIAFAAVFGGVVAATYVGNPAASLVKPNDLYANAWCYVGVFVLVVAMIEVLAALYEDQLRSLISIMFDRVLGLAAGLVVGVVEAGVLVLVVQAVADVPNTASIPVPANHTQAAVAVDNGLLTQLVVKLEPQIRDLLSPALPSSLENRLAQPSSSDGAG